ncbi:hypothetical protein [Candidatus Methylomicrobium oryzae]|jgi:hypothetical protein|uniref:hypothetical protein n=1 Tax=Candidatus Methylomicrobium oryzae TaxID=2802053 RepID=UPI00192288DF|nr:hypothetical protein [Methylomicrobium sp. RS1]MBL1264766.1 hypothetical protein [Methylomicrobium sp. RS1]
MTEGLFILTVIFVAYVVYQVVNDKSAGTKTAVHEETPAPSAAAPAPKPQPAAKAEPENAPKPAVPAPAPAAASIAPAPASGAAAKTGLRNPETGEVTPVFTNYRFAKRWIKEALVAEGLLDKIYKNNELDAGAEAKIKDAVAKLEAMPKYRA